ARCWPFSSCPRTMIQGLDLARPRIAAAKRRRASVPVGSGRFAGRRQVIGLDYARHPDHQRLAAAIERLARRRPDPTLAHAIFLDIAPLDAAKADANAAQERRFVIKRTRRVDAEPVWQTVGHFR